MRVAIFEEPLRLKPAYEVWWCRKRGLGEIRVVVRWHRIYQHFALVVLDGYPTAEVIAWFKEVQRDNAIYDARHHRILWSSSSVKRIFKYGSRIQNQRPGPHLP